MGDMADYLNDQNLDNLETLYDYHNGNISEIDTFEDGVVNEFGGEELGGPNLAVVGDVCSLYKDLIQCETSFLAISSKQREPTQKSETYWRSGKALLKPEEMTTLHLKNAIAYAERHNMTNEKIYKLILKEFNDR